MSGTWQQAIPNGSLVLAAVSGGADSVYLAKHLKEQFVRTGHQLAIAHVNHGLRGGDSDADEEFVKSLAGRLEVPCYAQRVDPASLLADGAETGRLPDENSLRKARLGILKALATALGARAIALGHHQDDLAESFLLMSLRGSGPIGLSAMPEVRRLDPDGLFLIRPLLGMTRGEIREALTSAGETWREDSSNSDTRFRRNFLREEILPQLNATYGSATRSLADSARLSGEMADWYRRTCEMVGEDTILARAPGAVLFKTAPLRTNIDHVLHAGVLRQWWLHAAGHRLPVGEMPLPPGRDTLTRMIARLREDHGATSLFENEAQCQAVLTNHIGIIHSRGMSLDEVLGQVGIGFDFPLLLEGDTPPESLDFDGESRLEFTCGSLLVEALSVHCCKPSDFLRRTELIALLDHERVTGTLRFAVSDPSEKVLVAHGMHKSVRKCLQEAGVPDFLTSKVPVLSDDEGVLWIPGIRRAARAWVGDGSSEALRLEWLPQIRKPDGAGSEGNRD